METALSYLSKVWKLPPLILHPFSDPNGPDKLVESSRASLMLQGLLPSGELSREALDQRLLEGRFCELRMLFYVGRDLIRWIEQCLEVVERNEPLRQAGIRFQSFAQLLVEDPPKPVREKLKRWGVVDYRNIFSRALGLNSVFSEPPEGEILSPDFVRHYYRYADQMFTCRQRLQAFTSIRSAQFDFELYASGEYTRMLEREWEADIDLEK